MQSAKIKHADNEKKVCKPYYELDFSKDRVKPYQVLAINRGETEKVLRVSLDVVERDWQQPISAVFRSDPRSSLAAQLDLAIDDAAHRLLLPAIERDVRRTLTEQAEAHAITVFATNLRGLLNQPPLAGRTILGIDSGFRTCSKIAVADPTGKVLATPTVNSHKPQKQGDAALNTLKAVIERYGVTLF